MTKSRQRISVIVPVYNGEQYLRQCVESALDQTCPPSEVIIVDDGSVDRTPEIAAALGERVRYLRQSRAGPAAARNLGVQAASGEYVAFLDADDVWVPEKLARQADYSRQHQNTDMVFGMVRQFLSPETTDEFRRKYSCPDEMVPGVHPGAMLLRRETFFRVGLFDSSLKVGEFIEWHARATSLKCTMHVLPELVMLRRIHPANYGITSHHYRRDYLRIVKGILQRDKGAAADD